MMTNEALQKGWNLRIIDEKYMFMDEKLNKIYILLKNVKWNFMKILYNLSYEFL